MDRNQLRDNLGDELNVIFATVGYPETDAGTHSFLYQFFQFALIQLDQCGSKRLGKGVEKERAFP